jgi:alginate production protein
MRALNLPALCLLVALLCLSGPAPASDLDKLMVGHWLEVRGQLDEDGVFRAGRVNLVEPRGEEEFIGTLSSSDREDGFRLLDQPVQVSSRTRFRKVDPSQLSGQRVKVEGHYRGPRRFSARTISGRGPGRERVVGEVRQIQPEPGGYTLTIMNLELFIAAEVELGREHPFDFYAVSPQRIAVLRDRQLSEEDQFGDGVRLTDKLRLATMIETRYTNEDNYNLDEGDEENREDMAASGRARLILDPTGYGVSGQLEYRVTHLWRKDDEDGRYNVSDDRLGESFVFLDDPFEIDFDIQVGRIDFDERREWVYDQNLDGVRAFWSFSGLVAEFSATTTLSDGDLRDENTDNYMVYVSDQERNFAGYVVHRDTERPDKQDITHFGVRAFGEWPEDHDSWLELSAIHGRRNNQHGKADLGGWGFDIGTTRKFGKRWFLTASWAWGQGDDDVRDGSDNNFRQTGLQDNNGRFGGVTSFRYYGELVDPELANLHIGTLGVGYRFTRESSLDLVGHYYRQDEPARKLIDSDLDEKANGVDHELGWEVDAILGWRPQQAWDFEVVVGWFSPGKAFEDADDAWISKLQVRYRY